MADLMNEPLNLIRRKWWGTGTLREQDKLIEFAYDHDIDLTPADFTRQGTFWCIDGMDAYEWLDAMIMD